MDKSTKNHPYLNQPGVFRMIPKHELHIDPTYQRAVFSAALKRMVKDWSWTSCGALTVASREDKSHWVIDGQHRLEAAMQLPEIKELPCLVFYCADVKKEASAFVKSNVSRKAMAIMHKFRALAIAEDEFSLKVSRLFEELDLAPAKSANNVHQIACIGSALALAKKDWAVFETVLRLCKSLAVASNEGIQEAILEGLFWMHQKWGSDMWNERIMPRCCLVGVRIMLKGAKEAARLYPPRRANIWALGITEELNKGLRGKNRIPVEEKK